MRDNNNDHIIVSDQEELKKEFYIVLGKGNKSIMSRENIVDWRSEY